jgi:hypothetical protein
MLMLELLTSMFIKAQVNYDDFFTDERMRVDLVFAGDNDETEVYLEKIKSEPEWGGTRKNMIDEMGFGDFQVMLFDKVSRKLIYSRGFNTLFEEWQTTAESKTSRKYLTESLVFPYPKNSVHLELNKRDNQNVFRKIYEMDIDPADRYIERGMKYKFETRKIEDHGDPAQCVDFLFIAEGYKVDQMDSFYRDVNRFSEYILSRKPFNQYRDKMNIWTVASVSQDNGTDFPGEGIWKNTILNTNFYTFKLDRYLTTYDYRTVCDVAAPVPYDHIIVLINIDRYGGGGFYNHYSGGSNGGPVPDKVLIHELGHGFAGLGDEYYTSDVAYEEFYKLNLEPWEPNLTTLVDFDSKWKDMLEPGTPIPTPAEGKFLSQTGVFEGGGYVSTGVYRPAFDCRMKSNNSEEFCEVCQRAIIKMIKYYTE